MKVVTDGGHAQLYGLRGRGGEMYGLVLTSELRQGKERCKLVEGVKGGGRGNGPRQVCVEVRWCCVGGRVKHETPSVPGDGDDDGVGKGEKRCSHSTSLMFVNLSEREKKIRVCERN